MATFERGRRIYLRSLGAIFAVAFGSLLVQIDGLIGSEGILPAADFLRFVHRAEGGRAFFAVPTLHWLSASDGALHAAAIAGVICSMLLIFDLAPALAAFGCWILYLSLVNVGQEFLAFQWDILLLEAGFFAIFLAPWRVRRGADDAPAPSPALLVFRLLLFKLMLSSGIVKLSSGDAVWKNLTALAFHYETQPLPSWIGWWAAQLPLRLQKASCAVMFAVELIVPFLLFAPRRWRHAAAAIIILFQLAIAATGNYAFFNFVTIAVALLAFDDAFWARFGFGRKSRAEPSLERTGPVHRIALGTAFGLFLAMSTVEVVSAIAPRISWPAPVGAIFGVAEPFHTINGYGLFAVMTTRRVEIEVQGSSDGENWKTYPFRWKPGDVRLRPRFVAPHQPRLDWQMWFAALGTFDRNPWFVSFVHRLLEGSAPVERLLAANPFPDQPPRYLRARAWDYHFTTRAERRASGDWWKRTPLPDYLPAVSLADFQPRH